MNIIKSAYNSKYATPGAFVALALVLAVLIGIVLGYTSMPVYSAKGLPSSTAGQCLTVEGRMPAGYDSPEEYEAAHPVLAALTLKTTPSSCNEVRIK